jgi:hypothetical protein
MRIVLCFAFASKGFHLFFVQLRMTEALQVTAKAFVRQKRTADSLFRDNYEHRKTLQEHYMVFTEK